MYIIIMRLRNLSDQQSMLYRWRCF